MTKKQELIQFVIRITPELDAKIEKESQKNGLTKAGWARNLIMQAVTEGQSNG